MSLSIQSAELIELGTLTSTQLESRIRDHVDDPNNNNNNNNNTSVHSTTSWPINHSSQHPIVESLTTTTTTTTTTPTSTTTPLIVRDGETLQMTIRLNVISNNNNTHSLSMDHHDSDLSQYSLETRLVWKYTCLNDETFNDHESGGSGGDTDTDTTLDHSVQHDQELNNNHEYASSDIHHDESFWNMPNVELVHSEFHLGDCVMRYEWSSDDENCLIDDGSPLTMTSTLPPTLLPTIPSTLLPTLHNELKSDEKENTPPPLKSHRYTVMIHHSIVIPENTSLLKPIDHHQYGGWYSLELNGSIIETHSKKTCHPIHFHGFPQILNIQEHSRTSISQQQECKSLKIIERAGIQSSNHHHRFSYPLDVTISDRNSLFYLTDTYSQKIVVFDLNDHSVVKFTMNCPSNPRCLAINESDNTIIFTCDDNYVYKYSWDGSKQIWKSNEAQLNWPRGIAIDPQNEDIYLCDFENHRIQVLDANGKFKRGFGQAGSNNGEFHYPKDIDFDMDGNLVVSDRQNSRILILSKHDGSVLKKIENGKGSQPGQFNCQEGFCIDRTNGNIIVCDSLNHRIQIFKSNLELVSMFGSLGDQQGQLQKPTGCDLNINTGELFIVEWQGERLQIFDYSHLLSKSGLIYFRNKLFKNIGKLSDIIVETRE